MDPVVILNLIVAICLAAERIFRRFERMLEARTPPIPAAPTEHLELPPPPTHRRVITIDVPPPDLTRKD